MTIKDLLASRNANISVMVSLADLKEFALYLMDEAQEAGKAEKEPETYLKPQEVAEMIGVSTNTLWRWNSSGYLRHVKVGSHFIENLMF